MFKTILLLAFSLLAALIIDNNSVEARPQADSSISGTLLEPYGGNLARFGSGYGSFGGGQSDPGLIYDNLKHDSRSPRRFCAELLSVHDKLDVHLAAFAYISIYNRRIAVRSMQHFSGMCAWLDVQSRRVGVRLVAYAAAMIEIRYRHPSATTRTVIREHFKTNRLLTVFFFAVRPRAALRARATLRAAILVQALLPVICLVGFVGNILVCIAIGTDRRLHNVTNYFLFSLALADLFVCGVVMPFALIVELRREFWSWTFGWCLLYAYLDVFLCSASIVHISVISLDRYFGIAQPLKMRNKSCTVVVAKIITVWLTITIISSPLAVLAIMDHSNILHENVCAINNRYYMIYGSTLSFLIPFIIMALTFLRTRYLLKQQVCALYSPATPSVTGSATAANASPTAAAVAIGAAASAATNAAKKFSATISSACGAAAADSNGLRKTVARRKLDYIRTNSLGRSTTVSYGGFGGRHKGPITSAHKNSFSSRTSTMTISGGSAGNTIFKGNASPASTRGHTAMSYGNFANENNSNSVSCQNSLSAVSEFDFALCTGGCQGGEARLWRQLAYIVHIIFYYCKTSDDTAVTIANGSRLDLSGLTTCETTKNVAAAAPFSSSVSANERILERYRDRNRNRENARYHQMNQRRFNAHRNHSGGGSRMAAALRRGRHAASSLKLHSVSVENEEKATRVLAFVFSCFFVCWTPFFLSNFAVGFCGAACAPPDWAASLFLWLGYASSTLNPIIYTVFNERFRQAFWRILQCQCAPSKHRKQQRFAVHQQQLQYTSYAWQHQYSTIRQPRGAQTPLASGALHGHDSSSGKWDSLYKLDRTRLIRGASVRGDVASADETRRHIPATAATRAGAIRVASPLATANHNSKISSSLMDDMRKASVCQQSSCYNLNRDAYGQQCNIRDQQVTRQHIHKANLRRQSVAFSENGENLSAGLNETGASSDGASPCVPVLARRLSTASACCLLYSSRTTPTSSEDAFARRYNSISVCNSNCSLNNQISSEIDESTATTIAKTSTPFFRYRKPLMKRKKNLSKDCAGYRIVSEFGAAARTRKANVDNTVGFPMSSDSLLSGDSIGVTSVGTLIDAGSDTVIKVLLRQKIPQKVRCFEAKNRIQ